MPLPKEAVTAVVAEASKKMSDPNYAAVLVGGFVQAQSAITQYISAHDVELGGADAIVNVVFHAALIGQFFQRGTGPSPRIDTFDELHRPPAGDSVASAAPQPKRRGRRVGSTNRNSRAASAASAAAAAAPPAATRSRCWPRCSRSSTASSTRTSPTPRPGASSR